MANPNPYQARSAKALQDKPGDLQETRQRIWGVLCVAYDDVGMAEDPDDRRRAMLAFVQVAGVYSRLYEAAEILPRLEALEAAVKQGGTR
jgi:hypothetical protein